MTAIYATIEFIRRNPHAAERTTISDVNAKIVKKYRFKVFYRVLEKEGIIEIVHVRHTSHTPWTGVE